MLEHLLATYRAPVIPELPPLHGGLMGYLGYDVIREVERLPNVPPDDRHVPDAVMSMIGSLAAFDHWRQRVTLIESVPVLDLDAAGARRRLRRGRGQHRAGRRQPRPAAAVRPGRAAGGRRGAARGQELDARRAVPAGRRGGQGAHRRRRHLPGRAGPALRPRTRRRPVRRLPRAAPGQPEPVHVLRAPRRADDRRLVARADGAAARRHGDLAADRRHAQAGEHRRARPAAGRRADRAPEGAGRARDARRPRPQRRRARRPLRHRARRRADDARALQPRDAPHVAGVRATCARGSVRSTCCGPRCRPARSAGRRRCGRWRSSTTSSRSSAGPYAGVVGYVDWSGNLDTAIAIRTMFCAPTGTSLQAGAGIVADSDPDDEDLECRNKAAALLAAIPAARRMTAARRAAGTPA